MNKQKIINIIKEEIENSLNKKYSPNEIYLYINKLHKKGWEKKKFEDPEWIKSHEYFILKEISLTDKSIKWNVGQHPPVAFQYSKMETELPPIVIASNGYIIDGTHRVGAAKKRGDKTIKAFVGVE